MRKISSDVFLIGFVLLYFVAHAVVFAFSLRADSDTDDRFVTPPEIARHMGSTYYHYCPDPARSHNTVLKFYRMTGYPHGRVGFVADHVVPLCAGGVDLPSNLQWQTREQSLNKDAWERRLCNALREGQEKFDLP